MWDFVRIGPELCSNIRLGINSFVFLQSQGSCRGLNWGKDVSNSCPWSFQYVFSFHCLYQNQTPPFLVWFLCPPMRVWYLQGSWNWCVKILSWSISIFNCQLVKSKSWHMKKWHYMTFRRFLSLFHILFKDEGSFNCLIDTLSMFHKLLTLHGCIVTLITLFLSSE